MHGLNARCHVVADIGTEPEDQSEPTAHNTSSAPATCSLVVSEWHYSGILLQATKKAHIEFFMAVMSENYIYAMLETLIFVL